MVVFSDGKIKMSNALMEKLYQFRRKLTNYQHDHYPSWLNDALIRALSFSDLVLKKMFEYPASAAFYVIVLPILFMMETLAKSEKASDSIRKNIKIIINSTKEKTANNQQTKNPLALIKNLQIYLYSAIGISTVIILGGITNWLVIPYKDYVIPVILELISISNLLLLNAPLYAVNAPQFLKQQLYRLISKEKATDYSVINQIQEEEQAAQAILAEIKPKTPPMNPTYRKIDIPNTELPSSCSTSRGSSPKDDSLLPSANSDSDEKNVKQFPENLTEPYDLRITNLFKFYNLKKTRDSLAHVFRTKAGENDTETLELIIAQDKSVIDMVNTKSGRKVTALHLAILKQHVEAVFVLIKAGASTNIQDATGKTALDLLKESTNSELVEIVKDLEAEIQPSIIDLERRSDHVIPSEERELPINHGDLSSNDPQDDVSDQCPQPSGMTSIYTLR